MSFVLHDPINLAGIIDKKFGTFPAYSSIETSRNFYIKTYTVCRSNVMKTNFILSMFTLGLLVYTSCATIVASGPDNVPVSTNPNGARVYVDGNLVGQTPTTISLNRKSEGIIRLELDGYEPVTIDRDKVLNGWFLGNVILGGLVGVAIDLITSNQGKYSEQAVYAQLTPIMDKHSKANPAPLKIPLKPASSENSRDPFDS